mgnify:CR=1 FL=1
MSDDLEPGELPICQSPFLPTSDGEGIIRAGNFFWRVVSVRNYIGFLDNTTLLGLSRRAFFILACWSASKRI